MASAAPVQNQAPKPPGLLPKNVQSWLLAGLALLMVLIMWLTGGKKPASPGRRSTPPPPAVEGPIEFNEARILELQSRIQELQRERAVAENALAQQSRSQENGSSSAEKPADSERTEDSIEAEQRKRDYLSQFASNIALSYRRGPAPEGQDPAPRAPEAPAQPPEWLRPLPSPVVGANAAASAKDSTPPAERKEEPRGPAAPGAPSRATGKTYVLFEGTIIETVLLNRLDGQFAGPVECLVTTPVYSHDRQHLLIPAGSKVLGEAKRVESFGQSRLAVSFHRLLMPDGYSASLDRFAGMNQAGDTGLRDQVNNHYLRIFGASLAIGTIGAAAEGGTPGALSSTGADRLRQGFAASTAQSSAQVLDRFLNVLPTVTIREGHRVKVYLSGDLALPDDRNHAVPSNL